MALYLKTQDLIDYFRALRTRRKVNDSQYMDNALLNIQQLIEIDQYNPCIFDYVEIGNCENCRWKGRHQKCSCCRRNRYIKDCYETEWNKGG